MKVSGTVVFFVLAGLFLAAIAARHASTSRLDSPYFRGTSAMSYRHAMEVTDRVSLRARDTRANHPEGYTPARYRAAGSEYFMGWVYRGVRFLSEADGRTATRHAMVILSALCVFTIYGVARRLWQCQAAGLLSAFLVAFLPPLVHATNGRAFSHEIVAAFVLSLHAALALRLLRATSMRGVVWGSLTAGLAALAALWVWEASALLLIVWMAGVAALPPRGGRARVGFLVAHAAAFAAALAAFPHLTSGESFPTLAYVFTRLRFLFGRPVASLLSDQMRCLWTLDHAPLPAGTCIALFLPIAILSVALAVNRAARATRIRFVTAVAVAGAGALAAAIDRSVLPVAALAMIPVVSGGAIGVSRSLRVRAPLIALGALVVFAGTVFPEQWPDAASQIARAAGVEHRDPYSFLWVSLENTDRELVRFVSRRTSVRDAIFAPDDLSALLLTFTGRKAVTLPGGSSPAVTAKRVALTRGLYGDEDALYTTCRDSSIDYIVYSIDVMLDSGEYSPRYLAATEAIGPRCVAFRMHFDPVSLRHFTLVYENDHYRLFKVTEKPEMVFLTDHPPFYDPALLKASGGNPEAFRRNIVSLMLTYADGVDARSMRDFARAREQLERCIRVAPHFTRARLALADVLMDQEKYSDARDDVMAVIAYAPDNSQALYYAAFVNAQLGKFDEAKQFLTVMLSHERDPELVEKARLLQAYMDNGLPLEPGAPRPTPDAKTREENGRGE